MTDNDLAAAVRAAVDQWMQLTPVAQWQAELSSPANICAALAPVVSAFLARRGHPPGAARTYVLSVPYFHLKGVFDPSSLPDTPMTFVPVPYTFSTVAGRAAAFAIHGLLRLETISYGSENSGNLFVNLVAMSGSGAFAEKSKASMRGHTDAVSFPFSGEDDPHDRRIAPSPDFVTLVGLRNPLDVPTKLMLLSDVLARLSPADVAELKKPQYSILAQRTFRQGTKAALGREHLVLDAPVLKDSGGETYVRYSHSTVLPMDTGGPAEQASNNFEAACNASASPVVVKPGDLLVVSNRLALHGRGEVGEEVGGQSRWLLRTYGLETSNLAQHKRHSGAPHMLFP